MAPALAPALIGQEAAACALLGLVLGSVRAVFPVRGRAAFLPDMALVGAVLLGLQSYFTSGETETRAWTIPVGAKAPQAAGVIHTDFERGFIKAETASFEDYVALGGEKGCRDAGKLRQEGKDYVVQDGDVMHFKFNV